MTEPPNSPPESQEPTEPAEPVEPTDMTPAPEPASPEATSPETTPVSEPEPATSPEAPPAWVAPTQAPPPAPGVTFGGFWIRVVAYLVDVLIISLGLIPLVVVGFWNTDLFWIVFIAYFVWVVGYFVWFWVRGGSTPGMALFGLRVVRDQDGGSVGLGKALLRYLGIVVSTMVSYVGLIWVAFDQRKRGWHDLMAGTVVIRTSGARTTGGRRLLTIGGAALGCLTWIIGIVAIVVFSTWLALNLVNNGIRDSDGAISTPQTLSVQALRVGDCFDFTDTTSDVVETVHAVPCANPHVYEVFFSGEMPDGTFPTSNTQGSFADENCTPAFEEYVGVAYNDSAWNAFYIGPSESSWSLGDRTLICQLHNADETSVTGSARDSNQ